MQVWLSIMQVATPLGVMVGYTVSGYMSDGGVQWQGALLLQGAGVA